MCVASKTDTKTAECSRKGFPDLGRRFPREFFSMSFVRFTYMSFPSQSPTKGQARVHVKSVKLIRRAPSDTTHGTAL